MKNNNIRDNWVTSSLITVLVCYVYFALEWLFFVTKPSMFNFLSPSEQLAVLFISPVPLVAISLLSLMLIFFPLAYVFLRVKTSVLLERLFYVALPAFIMSCILLLLIDNFTYTLFKYAVFTDTVFNQVLYAALFACLFFWSCRFLINKFGKDSWLSRNTKLLLIFTASLLVLTTLFSIVFYGDVSYNEIAEDAQVGNTGEFKNVLIFSSDGINSSKMSLFGYERETTPYLESIRDELMIYQNHFTNSAKTTGSIASLLSGKMPTTTRVIYRPDIFTGIHVYQHLPGLLKAHGFDNGDFSVRHYADAYDINMRNAFRFANDRNLEDEGLQLPNWFTRGFLSTSFFIEESYNRISGRLLHIMGIRSMHNPFMAVTKPDPNLSTDRKRIKSLKTFMTTARKPFFAHVHLLGTHGDYFPSETKKFSVGQKQDKKWMSDFYDDAVLQYDTYISEIIQFMKDEGLYDNTLLILNTDHGYQWAINEPLPLMIHFPDNEYVGVATANNQRLDIAPTILDYLGIARPEWMEGKSLLGIQDRGMEPIFVTNRMPSTEINGWKQVASPEPPFYTLGELNMIVCNKLYKLSLKPIDYWVDQIRNYNSPCDVNALPTDDEGLELLIGHLEQAQYNTSSIDIKR